MATFKGVNLRLSYPYVTDVDGFEACYAQDGTPYAQITYGASHGYGWDSTTGMNYRNRSITVDTRLAGMHFTSTNGRYFRLDLPNGAGTYRVSLTCCDAFPFASGTGWIVADGGVSTIATINNSTPSGSYTDISNTSRLNSGFSLASEQYIQHTFTSSFLTVTRDTTVQSGNGMLSAVWVNEVTAAADDYNPFTNAKYKSRTFNNKRFG